MLQTDIKIASPKMQKLFLKIKVKIIIEDVLM